MSKLQDIINQSSDMDNFIPIEAETTSGEYRIEIIDPDIYHDDPVGKYYTEPTLGIFIKTKHGTWKLHICFDPDEVIEKLLRDYSDEDLG